MHQAVLLCRGTDAGEGTRWYLYGLPGNVYFTIEVPRNVFAAPFVVPCTREAAAALYDDAETRDSPTLDVERAFLSLRASLLGRRPWRAD
jgi:hypothetical protein